MSDNLTDIWADRRVRIGYETAEELARCYNRDNWRAHPENQRAATEESLDTLGLIGQIKKSTVNNLMFDGHLRVELALAKNPQMLLPVDYYDLNDDETALALTIHDAITEQAEPIPDKLAALLERTRAMTADRPGLGAMLERLKLRAGINGHQKTEEGPPPIDKAAELQKVWGVQVGDVWELGQHRLVCGDCTDQATVEAVMRGERADTLFTDPPYNVGREYTEATDDNRTSEDYKNWTRSWVGAAFDALKDDADIFVTPGHRYYLQTTGVLCEFGKYVWTIAWIKTNSMMRSPTGFNTWEPISWIKNGPPVGYGNKRYDTLNVPMVMDETTSGHPTPKPLNLLLELFKIKGDKIATVIDSFLGSGTTLIACEQLGRRCRGVEIDPGYCAVTLERWSQLTGQTPRRVSV